MPTAIQTLKWRGFGFDRGKGCFEVRVGLVGFAFLRRDVWTHMQALEKQANELIAQNESLKFQVAFLDGIVRSVQIEPERG
ncbi:hypothetical protein [Acetobacter senegalensis]|uniref:hypothetical protein n=1 Tax=Acetobacter senegalensis TaxID=446692 RepID=UPI001EDC9B2F|nr:hypothetical protein [Acetobacter senegalensis]MCG4273919.1 hypothetical protein [Acetobacter senegalensis]